MLEVVEHDENLAPGELPADRLAPARRITLPKAERAPERREHLCRLRERGEVDEQGAVCELLAKRVCDLDSETGLADSAGPDERYEPRPRLEQESAEHANLVVATDCTGRRGSYPAARRYAAARRSQCRVVAQDPPFELAELGAGLQPQLGIQVRPALPVAGKCVRLPSRSVESGHQLSAQPLPEGMAHQQPFEIRDQLLVLSKPQPGFEASLLALEPELFEPERLVTREELVAEPGEDLPAPQIEGPCEEGARKPVVPVGECAPAVCEQVLEPLGVDLALLDDEPVAGAFGDEAPGR